MDGTYHYNLRSVSFETNITRFPRKWFFYRSMGTMESYNDPSTGALMGRFVWSLSEFASYWEDAMDRLASKQLFYSKAHQLLGFAPSDAPWSFDLAVDSRGHACIDIEEYEYSYGSPRSLYSCKRVWDPDGSVHGQPRSYGPYNGMTVSFSDMSLLGSGGGTFDLVCSATAGGTAAAETL